MASTTVLELTFFMSKYTYKLGYHENEHSPNFSLDVTFCNFYQIYYNIFRVL